MSNVDHNSAEKYIRRQQELTLCDPIYGFDHQDFVDDGVHQKSRLEFATEHSEYRSILKQLPAKGLNRRENMHFMANTLHEDISALLGDGFQKLLSETLICFLPTGFVGGCVLRDDGNGNRLDKYVIALNHGLFFAISRLCEGLVLEILQGKLAEYAASGAGSFSDAISRFLNPTRGTIIETRLERDWPEQVFAEFDFHSASLAAIILQFVAIHEFGHVVHGDVDSEDGFRFYAGLSTAPVVYRRGRTTAKDNWGCEYNADAFAIEKLCDWRSGKPSCWSNVAQIYLFFSWLETIETRIGKSFIPIHPPAGMRKKAIVSKSHQCAATQPPEDYFGVIDEMVSRWGQELRTA